MQVGARRTEAMPPEDRSVKRRKALLAKPVDIFGERVARLPHGLKERLAQRVYRRAALELLRTVATAPLIGAR